MDFVDKLVVVSGASAGIGAEFARQFHARGVRVVLIARREDKLAKLVEEMNEIRQGSAKAKVTDLLDPKSCADIVSFLKDTEVDILVNNVGRGSFGAFETLSIEREIEMLHLNVEVPLRLAHAVIPQMKERKKGAIISVSSIAGFQPLPFMATYSATKAANYSHSLALRNELAEFGVRVLTVCPGPVETEFGDAADMPEKVVGGQGNSVYDVVSESIKALEKNRAIVVPTLSAKAMSLVSSLFTDASSTWITGQVLKRSRRSK